MNNVEAHDAHCRVTGMMTTTATATAVGSIAYNAMAHPLDGVQASKHREVVALTKVVTKHAS